MKRVLSGVQPTGDIHIGNYVGAMMHFVELQQDHECYFCIVDLHALTVPQDPEELRNKTYELAGIYLAIGLDPEKSTIFVQSQVSAHAELAWLLSCMAYFGELSRMTQFKDKSKGKENVSVGLFTYPVLMAADILLYQADYVPVGNDQKQHLELTRDLAERFNNRFGETFVLPEPLIADVGARIMSLTDPTKKMSKSDADENGRINLLDSPDVVKKKIMRAITDSESVIRYDPENKPGVSNLLSLYSVMSGLSIPDLEKKYEGCGYGILKKDLVDVVNEKLKAIQDMYYGFSRGELEMILRKGREKAEAVAEKTLHDVKSKMGLVMF
ncbi:tryptophan--tRNA ligase [Calorimonas adulescens]|uniref:Tryptophan--tRNA ligase n=1 Tax=Calorimonas adulescens TaxID=2606906 RepID=A0A5D8QFK1_9THEO|nr:tryptophan--tRNA ligase [Calorimonas adulescens]TZE82914.1 tryptophan--tRNA ligase [Calorimonas adulescens]